MRLEMKMFLTVIILIVVGTIFGGIFLSNWKIPAPTKAVSQVIDDSKFKD
jgi:Na+/H+ antiporter NhaC